MIDHIGFNVSDFARSKEFFLAALTPLGYSLIMEVTAEQTGGYIGAGFGRDGKPSFWIGSSTKPAPDMDDAVAAQTGLHIALIARDRAAVRAFHAAALSAGARDNGAPGLRPHYHPNYYGAFVLDPDGNNIEAVCHAADDE